MTPLRQRMIDEMELRGYSAGTIKTYVHAVARLSRHYSRSPDCLNEAHLRAYFIYLNREKKVARSTHTIALCGIRFCYERVLGRQWRIFDIARPKRSTKLPVVLSRDEVWRLLDAVSAPVPRACLTTIYACGLRLKEGAGLRISDVDGDRGLLRVHGKGSKDRAVPLPEKTLSMLRETWRLHRSPVWLFPCGTRKGKRYVYRGDAAPLDRVKVQRAFRQARQKCALHKKAHVHTLRHSYATHLLEDGVAMPLIARYLGHRSLRATYVYLHLTREVCEAAVDPINRLMERPAKRSRR